MGKKKAPAPSPLIAELAPEIVFQIPNAKGTLAQVFDALATQNVDIRAFCAHDDGAIGTVMLVPDDNEKAKAALKKLGISKIRFGDIVFVIGPNRKGFGAKLAGNISSAGIDITYSFASSGGGRKFGIAFQTDDNPRAVQALNKA